eukprot:m.12791 g.12791  ORF g.12791 m.12791 type:complete len:210 (-) comp4585_c0_seq1:1966-2595(-)
MTHTNIWQIDNGGFTSSLQTGPSAGEDGSSRDRYAYIESSTVTTAPSYLMTPRLNINTTAMLVFSYHMYGSVMGNLSVQECTTTTSCTTIFTQNGQRQRSYDAPWRAVLSGIRATTRYIRFTATPGGVNRSDICIDSISVYVNPALPGCSYPMATDFFRVTASLPSNVCLSGTYPTGPASTCYATSSGSCITDGPNSYGNNERCTVSLV